MNGHDVDLDALSKRLEAYQTERGGGLWSSLEEVLSGDELGALIALARRPVTAGSGKSLSQRLGVPVTFDFDETDYAYETPRIRISVQAMFLGDRADDLRGRALGFLSGAIQAVTAGSEDAEKLIAEARRKVDFRGPVHEPIAHRLADALEAARRAAAPAPAARDVPACSEGTPFCTQLGPHDCIETLASAPAPAPATETHPCERGVHPEGGCNCENDFYRPAPAPVTGLTDETVENDTSEWVCITRADAYRAGEVVDDEATTLWNSYRMPSGRWDTAEGGETVEQDCTDLRDLAFRLRYAIPAAASDATGGEARVIPDREGERGSVGRAQARSEVSPLPDDADGAP